MNNLEVITVANKRMFSIKVVIYCEKTFNIVTNKNQEVKEDLINFNDEYLFENSTQTY